MSDFAIRDPAPDRRRMLWCLGIALGLHVVILVALALGPGRSFFAPQMTPIPVEIELAGPPLAPDAVITPVNPGSASGGAAPLPSASVKPGSSTSGGVDSAGFIIPTPRAQTASQATSTGGSGFRVSGTQASGAQPLPDIANQPSLAAIAAAQQGKGTGNGASSGSGTGATQHSGQGVQVSGSTGSSSNLDYGQLDKALAGSKGGSGSGGSGTGQGTTGTGTGTGSGDQSIQWDQKDASTNRVLVSAPAANPPAWVATQGDSLSVTVSFTLAPNGLLSKVGIYKSSGYADVDSAVIEAIRHWRFTPVNGDLSVTGRIPYVIRAK